MTEHHHLPSELEVPSEAPDRNLALELVRVTEAAAMAAGRWVGRGDKNGADGAAVRAMRTLVSTVSMNGVVVIGEGEKDEAPMLFNGERVGDGTGPECDIAVDPIDGTTLTAKGMPNAIAVLAAADRGSMFDPSAVFYMDKLVTGPEAADFVDIDAPVSVNIRRVAKAKRVHAGGRHRRHPGPAAARGDHQGDPGGRRAHQADLRRRCRRLDLRAARGHRRRPAARHRRYARGHHLRLCREVPGRDDPGQAVAEGRRGAGAGRSTPGTTSDRVLTTDDLVSGENVFFVATGITDGELLRGVRYRSETATTDSIVMRSKSGTVRRIDSEHRLSKLRAYSAIDFDRAK